MAVLFWGNHAISNTSELLLNNVAFLKYFQIIQSFGLFILPPIFFCYLTDFGITRKSIESQGKYIFVYILCILTVVVSQPFISFLGTFNNSIQFPDSLFAIEEWMRIKEEAALEVTKVFLSSPNIQQTLLNAFIIAVLPAIGEELMFRGAIQRVLQTILKNPHISVILTAAIFSAIHMQFFGFLPRFALGIIFGYLMLISKNIWLPILAHFTNNFMAFLIYQSYIKNEDVTLNPIEPTLEYPHTLLIIFSLSSIVFIIWLSKLVIEGNVGRIILKKY